MAIVNNCVENNCINLNDYLDKKTNNKTNYLKNNKFLIDLSNKKNLELYERVAQDIERFNQLYEDMIDDSISSEFGGYDKTIKLYVKSRLFGN